ncbi:hypothetical protein SAMN04489740_3569 [Arthrobacter alpinus]|uniref:Uncharacterized protein n=1 Tax=Arthrobacter alpinus TaxID=656366 RepID=A0A1H5NBZ4_9MICC|nr:hypothetical protein [Arthrobacter alpinus]SEE99034.1 hypothetical protein SAMN04489740_3569 [Arthrobacter alpinus]
MDAQEQRSALVPDPVAIVGLVEKLIEGIWPRSEAERKSLFQRLGFTSGASWDDPVPASPLAHYALSTKQPGQISSSWNSFNGRFMGVSLQLYTSMDTDNPSTRQGYEDFRQHFATIYGEGVNPWHDPIVQACVWNVNGRRIAIRFFNLQHSGMLLTVDDAGLATAAEAEARRRNAPTHWNDSEERTSPFNLPQLGVIRG